MAYWEDNENKLSDVTRRLSSLEDSVEVLDNSLGDIKSELELLNRMIAHVYNVPKHIIEGTEAPEEYPKDDYDWAGDDPDPDPPVARATPHVEGTIYTVKTLRVVSSASPVHYTGVLEDGRTWGFYFRYNGWSVFISGTRIARGTYTWIRPGGLPFHNVKDITQDYFNWKHWPDLSKAE